MAVERRDQSLLNVRRPRLHPRLVFRLRKNLPMKGNYA